MNENKDAVRAPAPQPAEEPVALSTEKLRELVQEGLELRRKLAERIAPMKVITPDDLKTRMR